MTAHPHRCKRCEYGEESTGSHWCYANPPANGGHRQWISENTYNDFIAILGCATFKPVKIPMEEVGYKGIEMNTNIWEYKRETAGMGETCYRFYRQGEFFFSVEECWQAIILLGMLNRGE